jgi:hypothetical protein
MTVEFVPSDADASSLGPSCRFSLLEIIEVGDWLGGLEDIVWSSVGTDVGNNFICIRIRKRHIK